jgi:CBS domain-containing protein
MLVRDVMTSPAVTVGTDASIKDGLKLLDRYHVTALPVTDREGRLVGVVSEADLLRDAVRPDTRTHLISRDPVTDHPERIADVMSTLSMTVPAAGDLSEAIDLMTTTAVKSLPVVEAGRVVGVVSRSDIVHLLARSDHHIAGEVDELLRSAGMDCEVLVQDGVVAVDGPAGQRRVIEVIAGSVPGVISVVVRD